MLAFIVNRFSRARSTRTSARAARAPRQRPDFQIYSLLSPPKGWKVHGREAASSAWSIRLRLAISAARAGLSAMHPAKVTKMLARIAWGHRRCPTRSRSRSRSCRRASPSRARHGGAACTTCTPTGDLSATAAMLISELTGIRTASPATRPTSSCTTRCCARRSESARFVVTCARFNRGYLADIAPERADRIRTVYHGVDLPRFAQNGTPRHRTASSPWARCASARHRRPDPRDRDPAERGVEAGAEIVGRRARGPRGVGAPEARGQGDHGGLPAVGGSDSRVPPRRGGRALPAHHEDHWHPEHPDRRSPPRYAGGLHRAAVAARAHRARHQRTLSCPSAVRPTSPTLAAAARRSARPRARMAEEGRRRVAQSFDT